MINNIRFPEWAKAVESDKDEFYYPVTARKGRKLEEARQIYSDFLSQAKKHTESVNFYGWLNHMAVEGLVLKAYEASYDIAQILKNLPADKVVSTRVSHNKMRTHTAGDYKLDRKMRCVEAIALYHMDEKEKAVALSKDIIKEISRMDTTFLHSIAYNLEDYGESDAAREIYEFFSSPEGKKARMKLASSAMESCSYFYYKKDYDMVIETADNYMKLGEDPEKAAEHLYSLGATPYFKDHWKATYLSLKEYKELAVKAKNGEVIDMNHLKDGEYEGRNISFKGADFVSRVVIRDGKLSSITAEQREGEGKIFDDRPFAVSDILPERMLESNNYYVDSIASATVSSNSIKLGVMKALLKASK